MRVVVYATKLDEHLSFSDRNMMIEVWIEDLRLCINEKNEILRQDNPRRAYKHFGTINLSEEYCEIAKEYLESKEFFQNQNNKIFSAIRKSLIN